MDRVKDPRANMLSLKSTIILLLYSKHSKSQCQLAGAYDRLQDAVATAAFHNLGERYDPPKCHPNT